MAELTLDVARKILDVALAKGVEKKFKPLVVAVLDARGCIKITAAQDGTSLLRAEVAHAKAYGALAMGMGSRALYQRSQEQPSFVGAVNSLAGGRLIPVPGGPASRSWHRARPPAPRSSAIPQPAPIWRRRARRSAPIR